MSGEQQNVGSGSKWPPILAWAGLVPMWLTAVGLVGSGIFTGYMMVTEPPTTGEDIVLAVLVTVALLGMGAFMVMVARAATLGSLAAYFSFMGLVAFIGLIMSVELSKWYWWTSLAVSVPLMGLGAIPYVPWAKIRTQEFEAAEAKAKEDMPPEGG